MGVEYVNVHAGNFVHAGTLPVNLTFYQTRKEHFHFSSQNFSKPLPDWFNFHQIRSDIFGDHGEVERFGEHNYSHFIPSLKPSQSQRISNITPNIALIIAMNFNEKTTRSLYTHFLSF